MPHEAIVMLSASELIQMLEKTQTGRVQIELNTGQRFTGRFRTDILGPTAISAYFYGDQRDISLPLDSITRIEPVA